MQYVVHRSLEHPDEWHGVDDLPGRAGWRIHLRFVESSGEGPQLRGLAIFPASEDREIYPGFTVQALGFDIWADEPKGEIVTDLLRMRLGELRQDLQRSIKANLPIAAAAFDDRPRRAGRPGRNDAYYAMWALRYVQRVSTGSRSPLKDLATEHGLKVSQVRDIVSEARRRDLLTATLRGRSGGDLTEQARRLIELEE